MLEIFSTKLDEVMTCVRKKYESSLLVRLQSSVGIYYHFDVYRHTLSGLQYEAGVEFTIDRHSVFHGVIVDLKNSMLYAGIDVLHDFDVTKEQVMQAENIWKHESILTVVHLYAQSFLSKAA